MSALFARSPRASRRPVARRLAAALALAGLTGLLPAIVPAAHAGYAIVGKDGDTTLVSKGRVKQVSKEQAAGAFVFDLGRARMWFANPQSRRYWEGTVEEFCGAMQGMVSSAIGEMKEQMAKLPADQRAQMEQMMRQMQGGAGAAKAAPRVAVEATGERATIAGMAARKFRVVVDGKPYEDVWLTTDPALLQELNVAKAPDTWGRMAACQMGNPPAGAPATGAAVVESKEYRQLYSQGWPVKVVAHGEGGALTLTEVVRIERREIPEAEFTPPAGFRKTGLMEVMGAQ